MDKAIYEFFDRWAAYFQTRRGWNLLRVRVWVSFLMLLAALATANTNPDPSLRKAWLLLDGFIFGIFLWARVVLFRVYGDYPEHVRKCEKLNAIALEAREIWHIRMFFSMTLGLIVLVSAATSAVLLDINARKVLSWVWYGLIVFDFYLACCFYLGPGKHSRELNKQLSREAVTENTPA